MTLLLYEEIQQLSQLKMATHSRDLISKDATHSLMDRNLVIRFGHWYIVNELGLEKLIDSQILL